MTYVCTMVNVLSGTGHNKDPVCQVVLKVREGLRVHTLLRSLSVICENIPGIPFPSSPIGSS